MGTRRLTKKEMWTFAVGQLGWSILGGIINTWLVTFYLPTKQSVEAGAKFYVPTGLVIGGILTVLGLITFICRIFDAITDPLIASLSDRSKNPKGRRIPFMRIAAIPFAVITVLVFCAPVGHISKINIAYDYNLMDSNALDARAFPCWQIEGQGTGTGKFRETYSIVDGKRVQAF